MVKPGDPILKHLTAAWFNNLDAVARKVGVNPGSSDPSRVSITVVNHEAVAKDIYDPVAIVSPTVTYPLGTPPVYSQLVFTTKALSSSSRHNWAVLQEPLPGKIGATAEALLVGITWVNVPFSPTSSFRQFYEIGTGNVLAYSVSNRGKGYEVGFVEHTSGVYRGLVLLSKPTPKLDLHLEALGYVTSDFYDSPASFGVTITDWLDSDDPTSEIDTVLVVNRYNWESGAAGAAIHIRWRDLNSTWIPVQMEWDCDDLVLPPE